MVWDVVIVFCKYLEMFGFFGEGVYVLSWWLVLELGLGMGVVGFMVVIFG